MELAFVAPRLVPAPVGTVPSLPWRRVTKADSQAPEQFVVSPFNQL